MFFTKSLKDKSSDLKITSNFNCPEQGSAYVDTTVVDGKITGVHLKQRWLVIYFEVME